MIAYPVPFGYGVFPMPRARQNREQFHRICRVPLRIPSGRPRARLDLNHDSDNTPMWINAAAELQSAFRASPFRAASGMPNGSYSLSEAAAPRNMLRLACPACGRSGQYRIDRLLEEHGPDVALQDLRHELAQCPRRSSMSDLVKSATLIRSMAPLPRRPRRNGQ